MGQPLSQPTLPSLPTGCSTLLPAVPSTLILELKMARSMTITQEETPSTSMLFNIFLLVAFSWMALAAITSASAEVEDVRVESTVLR